MRKVCSTGSSVSTPVSWLLLARLVLGALGSQCGACSKSVVQSHSVASNVSTAWGTCKVSLLQYAKTVNAIPGCSTCGDAPTFDGCLSSASRACAFQAALNDSATVPCGFLAPSGFDAVVSSYLKRRCEVVIVTVILGNFDTLKQPINIHNTTRADASVCWVALADKITYHASEFSCVAGFPSGAMGTCVSGPASVQLHTKKRYGG
eukprot:NODE_2602_length_1382_cov_54.146942_g2473_i0.p1 GENE.NODE_2602_length_1382_cov_54.146942_g2473_i0~~NODE_2602_length_1382_cov_54.146942_g2473_i0.p1  ORF type:complete len:206 (+),score=17.45 NODE_2602_length_1382_cov_54.146942_g2473_i0:60-677(+)